MGDLDRARAQLVEAARSHARLAQTQFLARNYDEAIVSAQTALKSDGLDGHLERSRIHWTILCCQLQQNALEATLKRPAKHTSLQLEATLKQMGQPYDDAGAVAAGFVQWRELGEKDQHRINRDLPARFLAELAASMKQANVAIANIRSVLADPEQGREAALQLMRSPMMDPIRNTPAWQLFEKEMGV